MDDQALAEIAEGLYALPLDDFIAARAAAAKEAAGWDKDLAAAVRALPKPSVAAWAVNMLARHEPGVVEELADVGHRMQAAQSALDAASLRELARERRTMLSAAADTARKVAEEHGRSISGTMAGDVEETLRALTADPGAAVAVRSGRLLKTLTADGVNAVDIAGSVAVPSVLPEPDLPPVPVKGVPAKGVPAKGVPARTRMKERPTPAPASGGPARKHGAAGRGAATRGDPAKPPLPTKPRLEAVRQAPRPPSPSALEKARIALAEAQAAEEEAAARAAELQANAEETRNRVAALQEETSALRNRLKAADEELERLRRALGNTSAEAKQAVRAADKAARTAMLAQERVLRFGNTRS
ncbi:hypothetical protein ACIQC0_05665 [Pseudarthrobacter sp. NPDC092419]|uniref:hypothetical protein n=1 Tax=Pseudarthrobacter sp. NPDC092419 TaxID=3364414 RepID=UPI0038228EDC